MTYETLFEISKFQLPWGCIIYGLLSLVSIANIAGAIMNLRDGESKYDNIIDLILWGVALVVCAFMFAISVDLGGSERSWDAKQYYSGNYEIVEGEIYDFKTDGRYEFYVDGIYFHLTLGDAGYSHIKGNGQQVRISYIPYYQPMEDGTFRKECEDILKFEIAIEGED